MRTKEYYIDIAKENPEKHKEYQGYVYIGPGYVYHRHADFFGDDVSCFENGEIKHKYCGNVSCIEYYVNQPAWEEKIGQSFDSVMNNKKEITLSEIKAQYEEAQKLIGKTVKYSTDTKGIVSKVVFSMFDDLGSQLTKDFYKENGYVIGVYFGCYRVPHTQVELCKPVIKVKNTDGQEFTGQYDKDANIWTFGCAKIDGSQINHLAQVIGKTTKGKSIESVNIGKGIFPTKTIEEMYQIQLDETKN